MPGAPVSFGPTSPGAAPGQPRSVGALSTGHAGSVPQPEVATAWQGWWPRVKRGLTWAFLALVVVLLVRQGRDIPWGQVLASMRRTTGANLAWAAGLAATSHLLYSGFDLFGCRMVRHRLPVSRVMAVTFVSYVFNLNFGSLVGGFAIRYRLYARLGLATPTITAIVVSSMLTNWLGFLLVGGTVMLWRPPVLPSDWALAGGPLRWIGAGMLALALAWLLACSFARRRTWRVRGRDVELPGAGMAALQLMVASANWLLMAGVVYTLFAERIAFADVLSALLIAGVAGVLTHVPAGLGVTEAVFVALLGSRLQPSDLLGALLLYRAIYFLVPLALALPIHWRLESVGKPPQTDGPGAQDFKR